ncbi:MAG: hypothetical protein RR522_01775, partial [Alistipes sp.]
DIDQLEAKFTELAGQLVTPTKAAPLLMSGKTTDTSTSTSSPYSTISVGLKRQAVKIELTVALDPKFTAVYPALLWGEEVESQHHAMVELRNAPNRSYVCEQTTPATPTGNKMFRYTPVAMTQTGSKTWTSTFYLYENPVQGSDTSMVTHFSLRLPYKDGANAMVTENYYRFDINTADAANPHATRRNKLYRLKANVLGFGSSAPTPTNAKVITEVLDWNGVPIDTGSIGDPYFSVEKTYIDVKHSYTTTVGLIAADISNIVITYQIKNKYPLSCKIAPDGKSLLIKSLDTTSFCEIPRYNIIRLNRGGQMVSILVRYLPHIAYRFAEGNLVNDTAGTLDENKFHAKMGTALDRGLHFRFGSTLGYAYSANITPPANDAKPSYYTAEKYITTHLKDATVQIDYPAGQEGSKGYALRTDVDSHHSVGLSDICAYTYGGYRTPTAAEWEELLYLPSSGTTRIPAPKKAIYNGATLLGWAVGPNYRRLEYKNGEIVNAGGLGGAIFLPVTGRIKTTDTAWTSDSFFYMSSSISQVGEQTRPFFMKIVGEELLVGTEENTHLGALRCIAKNYMK